MNNLSMRDLMLLQVEAIAIKYSRFLS